MTSNQSSFFQSCPSTTTSSTLFGERTKRGFWDRTLNFRTTIGRYFLIILLLTSGLVPAAILLVQNIKNVYNAGNLDVNLAVNQHVKEALEIRMLVYNLQLERGLTALYVSSGGDARTRGGMLRQRMEVDKVFYGLGIWPNDPILWSHVGSNKSDMILSLVTFRHDIDMQQVDDYDVIRFYSNANLFLLHWMMNILHSGTLGTLWTDLVAFEELAISTEHSGQERARGAIFFTRGYVSPDNLRSYLSNVVVGKKSLAEASEFSTFVSQRTHHNKFRDMTEVLNKFREIVINNGSGKRETVWDDVDTANQWVVYMTQYINALHDVLNDLGLKIMQMTLESSVTQRAIVRNSSVLTAVEFFGYPVFVILTVRLTSSIKKLSVTLSERITVLAREQKRNATLLKEMYPPTVAQRLLKGKTIEPESFESATVCFSGLANFAELSSRSHGVDIIFFVNRLFDLMDEEIIKHDVFKVETVGDQYVVVSGVPIRNGDSHVAEVADMALGLLEQTAKLTVDHLPNYQIMLKFGVCSGSVVAGIVGLKMPRYCLFGDTVNVASRMHSNSEALRVHLSTTSGELLIRNRSYDVRSRGQIPIKGKGLVETFWLCGKFI